MAVDTAIFLLQRIYVCVMIVQIKSIGIIMNDTINEYKLNQLLDHLNNLVLIVSSQLGVSPNEFEIMGGFARRLYMLKNGILLTESDMNGIFDSDVDIFCHVNNIIDDKVLEMLEDVANDRYDVLNEKISLKTDIFDVETSLDYLQRITTPLSHDELENIVANSFYENSKFLIRILDDIIKTERDVYTVEKYDHLSENITKQTLKHYDISAILKQLEHLEADAYGDHISMSSDNSFVVNGSVDPSFKVSPRNASITVPVTPKLQIVANNKTNDETIEGFDFEQAKFKMRFPYSIEHVEKMGDVDDDNIYHINRVNFKSFSPFRIIDRLTKYSLYGFTFSDKVKNDLDEHIDEFVDGNDIDKLPTYISSLY